MENDKSGLISALFEQDPASDGINQITEKIIGCAYKVSNTLGCGFLEKVYENALAYELRKIGFNVKQQQDVDAFYEGVKVGHNEADLLVEDLVLVETKAVKNFDDAHKAQCLNYLKATNLRICQLINFGNPKVEIKRLVL